ncbi:MAG: DUF3592 domain-containing protein [Planctomycetia bacterium]|nr:DUF3592 domain-containing protein [Planctomycetia bacterium]
MPSDAGLSDELLCELHSPLADPMEAAFAQDAFGSRPAAPRLEPRGSRSAANRGSRAMHIFLVIGSLFSYAALGALLARGDGSRPRQAKRLPLVARVFLGVVGVLLLLGSPMIVFTAYGNYTNAKASATWPSVEGLITRSEVEELGFGRKRTFQARIQYRYQVNGRRYSGSRVQFANTRGGGESAAQSLVQQYPAHSTQKVFFDPADPSSSVLEPGSTSLGLILLSVGPLLAVGFALFFIQAARKA